MKNFSLPTVDHPVILISHGTTLIIERNHSAVEEYAVTGNPGFRIAPLTKSQILAQCELWAQRGFEVKI